MMWFFPPDDGASGRVARMFPRSGRYVACFRPPTVGGILSAGVVGLGGRVGKLCIEYTRGHTVWGTFGTYSCRSFPTKPWSLPDGVEASPIRAARGPSALQTGPRSAWRVIFAFRPPNRAQNAKISRQVPSNPVGHVNPTRPGGQILRHTRARQGRGLKDTR